MISKEKVVKRIESQIAVCKEIDSDWITITVATGKRILELLKQLDEETNNNEIVRCKNCNNHDSCEMADRFGEDPEWFCADGEPKSTIER